MKQPVMRRLSIGMFFAIGLLTACSSSSSTSAGVAAANPAQTASSSPADRGGSPTADSGSAAPTWNAPTGYAATGTAADSQGDKATVSISIGSPVPLTDLNQRNVSACDGMSDLSHGADQTMAIPVQITITITSSLATPVGVGLDGTDEVTSGGNVGVNENWPLWATGPGGDGPKCDSTDNGVAWVNVAAGQPSTWSGWLIDPEAITPDDPTGSSAKKTIFLEPAVDVGLTGGNFVPDLADSQNLVKCAAGVPDGPVIAVVPQVALASGCTKYTGN